MLEHVRFRVERRAVDGAAEENTAERAEGVYIFGYVLLYKLINEESHL